MALLPVVQYRCTLDVLPRLGCRRLILWPPECSPTNSIDLFFYYNSFLFFSSCLFFSLLFFVLLRLQSIESTYQVFPFWFYTSFSWTCYLYRFSPIDLQLVIYSHGRAWNREVFLFRFANRLVLRRHSLTASQKVDFSDL